MIKNTASFSLTTLAGWWGTAIATPPVLTIRATGGSSGASIMASFSATTGVAGNVLTIPIANFPVWMRSVNNCWQTTGSDVPFDLSVNGTNFVFYFAGLAPVLPVSTFVNTPLTSESATGGTLSSGMSANIYANGYAVVVDLYNAAILTSAASVTYSGTLTNATVWNAITNFSPSTRRVIIAINADNGPGNLTPVPGWLSLQQGTYPAVNVQVHYNSAPLTTTIHLFGSNTGTMNHAFVTLPM